MVADTTTGRIYVGIDLAADPRRTGIAVLADSGTCTVESVRVGADDGDIVAVVRGADRVGVDVPLGWPRAFVDYVSAHSAGTQPALDDPGPAWRRNLAMRVTDREVHRRTGLTPLSVSTDRIAHPALRWSGIESRLRDGGIDAARDGSGVVCEVYPAAALRCWSLPHRGYKGVTNEAARRDLVGSLAGNLPWLQWDEHRELCTADDNALDAVLSALVAREVDRGRCEPPPSELQQLARQEGWIWLPDTPAPPSVSR